jgi:uncharacterized protein (TIGR02217 family)
MSYHNIRFPADISFKAIGGVQFNTNVTPLYNGTEKRTQIWSSQKYKYELELKNIGKDQANKIIAFFNARNGRTNSFRFKDWNDFEAKNQILGTGNGVNKNFQLIKKYGDAGNVFNRKITKPISDKIQIMLAGIPVSGSSFSVNDSTGIIQFNTSPANGVEVSANFEFDVEVRFDNDFLAIKTDDFNKSTIDKITMVEVK